MNLNDGVLNGVRRIGGRFRDLVVDGGLPGAPRGFRLRGATLAGAPTSGTWKVGDIVPDRRGFIWTCIIAGTPGSWVSCGTAWYDVKSFGAYGDGSHDDTTAIQNALTAAGVAGGVVYFPSGIYIISQSLQVSSNTQLTGDGIGASTIRVKASSLASFTQVGSNTGCPMIVTVGNAAKSHITVGPGITLDGNQANAGGSLPGFADGPECAPVGIWNSSQVAVDGIEIINAIGYSVYLQACNDSFVLRNVILSGASSVLGTNQQDGVHLTGCLRATVADNIIDTGTGTAGDDGIALQSLASGAPCKNITVSGNVIRSAQSNIHLALDGGNVVNVSISGNVFWGSATSAAATVLIDSATGTVNASVITIASNTFQTMAGDGIDITVPFTGVAITNNSFDTFQNSGNNGTYIIKGTDFIFSGNVMTTCTGLSHGLQIGDSSAGITNFTVSNNLIDMSGASSAGAGIICRDSVLGSISNNTIIGTGSGLYGIDVSGVGTAPTGIGVVGNRVSAWGTGINEDNSGQQPDHNVYADNNTFNCTAALNLSGTHNTVLDTSKNILQGPTTLPAGTATTAPLAFSSGTNLTAATAGAVEYDGVSTYITNDTTSGRGQIPVDQRFRLTATGSTISTIANYFGTSSNISLVSGAEYEIEIVCWFLKTTAGTVTWTFTNSAAPTSMTIDYELSPATGIVSTAAATDLFGQQYNVTTTAPTVVSASLTTGVNHRHKFYIRLINGTGTSLKIQATASAGSITPGINSYWKARRIPAANVGTFSA